MEKLDALIKKLQEAKEELEKNMNGSYASGMNMSKEDIDKGSKDPKFIEKEVKIKNLKDQVAAGTYKPDAGKIADKMISPKGKLVKEEFMMSENGQWSLHKKHVGFKNLEHKLEDEGHSKDSAGNIAYAIGAKKYGKAGMESKAHKSEEPSPKQEEKAVEKLLEKK